MDDYDEKYKPISPLGYIGYEILFALPIIGIVCALVFAITAKNQNKKNFATAQLIAIIIAVIVGILIAVLGLAAGMTPEQLNRAFQQ